MITTITNMNSYENISSHCSVLFILCIFAPRSLSGFAPVLVATFLARRLLVLEQFLHFVLVFVLALGRLPNTQVVQHVFVHHVRVQQLNGRENAHARLEEVLVLHVHGLAVAAQGELILPLPQLQNLYLVVVILGPAGLSHVLHGPKEVFLLQHALEEERHLVRVYHVGVVRVPVSLDHGVANVIGFVRFQGDFLREPMPREGLQIPLPGALLNGAFDVRRVPARLFVLYFFHERQLLGATVIDTLEAFGRHGHRFQGNVSDV